MSPQYGELQSPQYGELQSTNGWDLLESLGHPSKFQPISHLDIVTALTSLDGGQQNFARCLAIYWAGTLYIRFWGLWPPNGILPAAKFTLCPSLALSYIASITAQHSISGHQPNVVAWYKEWNYGTFAEGTTYRVAQNKLDYLLLLSKFCISTIKHVSMIIYT